MTRFNVAGQYIDLQENLQLQFVRKNILFAFDNIECERSASFSIPATPRNERVFGLASDIHTAGTAMRVRFSAEMQDGLVVQQGYLYLTEYDPSKRAYKAVFVTGELTKLKDIKSAGNIADYMAYTDHATIGDIKLANNNALQAMRFACMTYKRQGDAGIYVPSINYGMLLEDIATHFGVPITLPLNVKEIRILPAELMPYQRRERRVYSSGEYHAPEDDRVVNTLDVSRLSDVLCELTTDTVQVDYEAYSYIQIIQCYLAKQDLQLEFPTTLGDNWFLIDTEHGAYGTCIGDYSFDYVLGEGGQFVRVTTGEPLAGRTVTVPRGMKFMLFDADDFIASVYDSSHNNRGWLFRDGHTLDQSNVVYLSSEDMTAGASVMLQDNLPEMTYIDLLKSIAQLTGTMLYYDETNGISFSALSYATWRVFDITERTVSHGNVTRDFSDYAQRNNVQFAESDYMPKARLQKIVYPISNDNIAVEKDLYTLPFADLPVTTDNRVIVGDERGTTLLVNGNNVDAQRKSLSYNTNMLGLCSVSTQQIVTVRMTLLEWQQLSPMTLVQWDGARWVWTNAEWSKGNCKLSLSKI